MNQNPKENILTSSGKFLELKKKWNLLTNHVAKGNTDMFPLFAFEGEEEPLQVS